MLFLATILEQSEGRIGSCALHTAIEKNGDLLQSFCLYFFPAKNAFSICFPTPK